MILQVASIMHNSRQHQVLNVRTGGRTTAPSGTTRAQGVEAER